MAPLSLQVLMFSEKTDPLNVSRYRKYRKVLGEGQIWEAGWADHRLSALSPLCILDTPVKEGGHKVANHRKRLQG